MSERSLAEIVVRAMEQKKAHRILKFNQHKEGPPERFYVVDCRGHLERVPCNRCGVKPSITYSTDREYPTVDEFESVRIGCPLCFRHVELSAPANEFNRARGPISNALSSWWCWWMEPEYHPSDFEKAGGVILNAQVIEEHFMKAHLPAVVEPEVRWGVFDKDGVMVSTPILSEGAAIKACENWNVPEGDTSKCPYTWRVLDWDEWYHPEEEPTKGTP